MVEYISLFALGAITVSLVYVIFYVKSAGRHYVNKCVKTREDLEETLKNLNRLHNDAVTAHKAIEFRLNKLETTNAVNNYGVSRK